MNARNPLGHHTLIAYNWSLPVIGHCSTHSVLVHMSPVHGLYHLNALFCVSVFTDDGGRTATETFEYYFLFNVLWLVYSWYSNITVKLISYFPIRTYIAISLPVRVCVSVDGHSRATGYVAAYERYQQLQYCKRRKLKIWRGVANIHACIIGVKRGFSAFH